jgi:hypothetical protein
MATGATTGSRGGGSMQPGGHPAASPAHAASAVHPARVSTEEPALPLAAVHRAQEGALLAWEAQATLRCSDRQRRSRTPCWRSRRSRRP